MPDPSAEAYKQASKSYQAAMAAEAEKKKKEGDAAKKIADTQAKAVQKMAAAKPVAADSFVSTNYGGQSVARKAGAGEPKAASVYSPPAAPPVMADVNSDAYKEQARARALAAAAKPVLNERAQAAAEGSRNPTGYAMQIANASATSPQRGGTGVPGPGIPPPADTFVSPVEDNQMPISPAPLMKKEKPAAPKKPEAPRIAKAKLSKIEPMIQDMKEELGKGKKGPNFFDILQAAAAGWNMQTPAYVERQKEEAAKLADIEKLSKTAQFEKALQEERLASDTQRSEREIAARKELALIDAGAGIGNIPGLSKGKSAAVSLLAGLGVPGAKNLVKPKVAGGAH